MKDERNSLFICFIGGDLRTYVRRFVADLFVFI